MQKRLTVLLLCLFMMFVFAAGGENSPSTTLAGQVWDALIAGDEEKLSSLMNGEMAAALKGQAGDIWTGLENGFGKLEAVVSEETSHEGGYVVITSLLQFEKGYLNQITSVDEDNKVAGLFFRPASAPQDKEAAALPEGLKEVEVTVISDERYPLPGTLTLPEGEVKAGFVLVHGSGPQDRDETINANKPFRDFARGLAQKGFAVLRYDKRTFAFGADMAKAKVRFPKLTVDEETADDAAKAIRALRERPEMAGKKVFLLGHSMGGMLASYIGSKAPEVDGYVLLAGSPRKLWQIIVEQNERALLELKPEDAAALRPQLDAEIKKAERLPSLTDEDALKAENAAFGMGAWYLRHWEMIDPLALHMKDGKPVLVLQGEKDRQVGMTDFELWKAGLAGHPDAEFIIYPELNHLFFKYQGEEVPFSQLLTHEYTQNGPVDNQVISDIAAWADRHL